ncbi:MAG: HEPN domain-containing protein [Deltaproteobacteria bacterium]|nr:HEPN domain-containing protein [Deltaproteobacteria bacterium]
MKKTTANWLASADYDVQTAEAMLRSKRYVYVVFMCHLALEKTVKGLWAEAKNDTPPRIHDLLYFVRGLDLTLAARDGDFVAAINRASVPTRYPEDLAKMVGLYPYRTARSYLSKTKRVIKWLRKDLRLAQS